MTFLAPLMLIGLVLVPVLLGLYLWAQRRRQRYAVRFTNLDLLANLAPKRPAWRRHLPPIIYLAAIAALAIALARPQLVVPTPRDDATVMLAIDVSGSMKATDVAPTRLDAAKVAAKSFIDQLPKGIRVGIVSFGSHATTLVQPTIDREALTQAIDALVPRDGTAMGDGLMQVLDVAEQIQAQDAAVSPTPTTRRAASFPSGTPSTAGCSWVRRCTSSCTRSPPAGQPSPAWRRSPTVSRRSASRSGRTPAAPSS